MQHEPKLRLDQILKCGFKIGGGIDQDYRKSPQVGLDSYFSI